MTYKENKAFERNTRWLVRVDGFDYGPFEPEEIRQRVRDGRLTLRSDICEERDGRWVFLEDIPPFQQFCMRLIEEEKERARQAEMDRAETQVRRSHKLKWSVSHFGLIGALVAGGVVAFFLTRSPKVQPSNYTADIFYQTELGPIDKFDRFTGEREHEWRFGPEAPPASNKPKRKARRRRGRRLATDAVYVDKSPDSISYDFDFETEDGQRRRLSNAQLQSEVARPARRLLTSCLEDEADRRSGVSGADFQFYVLPTGRVTHARVLGAMSGKMHACTRRKLRRLHVEPFAGSPREVSVSLRIASQ